MYEDYFKNLFIFRLQNNKIRNIFGANVFEHTSGTIMKIKLEGVQLASIISPIKVGGMKRRVEHQRGGLVLKVFDSGLFTRPMVII